MHCGQLAAPDSDKADPRTFELTYDLIISSTNKNQDKILAVSPL